VAVFTKLQVSDFQQILTSYNIGEYINNSEISDGIENTNYILNTSTDRYIFTIYENRTNLNDLPYFLELKEYLSKNNFNCPVPIRDKNNNLFNYYNEKPYAIISFLEGKNIKEPSLDNISKAARKLAELHLCSQKENHLHRKNSLSIDFWKETYAKITKKNKQEFAGLKEAITQGFEIIDKNWPENLPVGIIHGDYFPDNVMLKENGEISGIIDFYMAANDILAYDLAIMINAWCFEKDFSFNREKLQNLLGNYNSIRSLSEAEYAALPILLVGASIRFLVTRLYDYFNQKKGVKVSVKDPREYLAKLRFHLNQL